MSVQRTRPWDIPGPRTGPDQSDPAARGTPETPATAFAKRFRHLIQTVSADRRTTLEGIARMLGRNGIRTSKSSLSRYCGGRFLPADDLVCVVGQLAGVTPAGQAELLVLLRRAREDHARAAQIGSVTRDKPPAPRRSPFGGRLASAVVVGSAGLVLGFGIGMATAHFSMGAPAAVSSSVVPAPPAGAW